MAKSNRKFKDVDFDYDMEHRGSEKAHRRAIQKHRQMVMRNRRNAKRSWRDQD